MGLDELHLRVLASSSDDRVEKKNAQKGGDEVLVSLGQDIDVLVFCSVLRLLRKGRHWVLVVGSSIRHRLIL